MSEIKWLKKRAEYLQFKNGCFVARSRSLTVLCRRTGDCRVGITASKRVGCAVKRNKAKRRLRCLVRECFEPVDAFSFILIANSNTCTIKYELLKVDMLQCINQILRKIHKEI